MYLYTSEYIRVFDDQGRLDILSQSRCNNRPSGLCLSIQQVNYDTGSSKQTGIFCVCKANKISVSDDVTQDRRHALPHPLKKWTENAKNEVILANPIVLVAKHS